MQQVKEKKTALRYINVWHTLSDVGSQTSQTNIKMIQVQCCSVVKAALPWATEPGFLCNYTQSQPRQERMLCPYLDQKIEFRTFKYVFILQNERKKSTKLE